MFQGMFLEQWYLYCSTVAGWHSPKSSKFVLATHQASKWIHSTSHQLTRKTWSLLACECTYGTRSHILGDRISYAYLYVYVTSDLKMCNLILYLAWAWCDLMVQWDWRPIFLEHIHVSKEPIHDTFMVSLMRMAWHGLRDAWMASGGS